MCVCVCVCVCVYVYVCMYVVMFCLWKNDETTAFLYLWWKFHSAHVNKVKWTLVQALRLCTGRTAHRGSRGIALHFLDHGTRKGWGVSVTPRPLFTPGKDPVSIVQGLGGPQGRSGQVRKISPPPGFDPRTVQRVASRYTDWAARPTQHM